jgi:hypothetical protein
MLVQKGSYQFPINKSGMTVQYAPRETPSGTTYLIDASVSIDAWLPNPLGDSRLLDAQINRMELAFANPSGDFGLLHDDGSPTHIFYQGSQTLGGIQVKMLSYPNYQGAEYVTYRTIQIQANFILVPSTGIPQYTFFDETIKISGGSPKYGVKEVNYGPGVKQQLRTHSKCIASQTGTARSIGQLPIVPPAIWPQALVEEGDYTEKTPTTRGSTSLGTFVKLEHEVSWSYQFEWPYRLSGSPHFSTE